VEEERAHEMEMEEEAHAKEEARPAAASQVMRIQYGYR